MGKILREIRREIVTCLADHGISNSFMEADLIVGSVIQTDRTFIYSHPEHPVSFLNERKIWELIFRRIEKKEPLQYILGNQEFYGYDIETGYGSLVPRPETELLVEKALPRLDEGKFLDWGTGSGAIAVALLNEKIKSAGLAVDRFPRALCWAWRNLKKHKLLRRCLLWHSSADVDLPVEDAGLELVISNPPYIRTDEIKNLMPEVREHEPLSALDGGKDGIRFYPELFDISEKKLLPGGSLLVEIGNEEQVELLKSLAPTALRLQSVFEDYSGKPRIMEWSRV